MRLPHSNDWVFVPLPQVIAGFVELLGPKHPETLASIANLASLLDSVGKMSEAEPLYRRVVQGKAAVSWSEAVPAESIIDMRAGQQEALGPQHPTTVTSILALADLLRLQGELSEAEQLYRLVMSLNDTYEDRNRGRQMKAAFWFHIHHPNLPLPLGSFYSLRHQQSWVGAPRAGQG